jgi:histidine ammonia-lyase
LGQGTARAHQIIRREVAFLERDRLIMDDARRMVELVKSRRMRGEGLV